MLQVAIRICQVTLGRFGHTCYLCRMLWASTLVYSTYSIIRVAIRFNYNRHQKIEILHYASSYSHPRSDHDGRVHCDFSSGDVHWIIIPTDATPKIAGVDHHHTVKMLSLTLITVKPATNIRAVDYKPHEIRACFVNIIFWEPLNFTRK